MEKFCGGMYFCVGHGTLVMENFLLGMRFLVMENFLLGMRFLVMGKFFVRHEMMGQTLFCRILRAEVAFKC